MPPHRLEILPSTGTNHAVHNSNFCLDGVLGVRNELYFYEELLGEIKSGNDMV